MASNRPCWAKDVKGVLLDISGVLYESDPTGGTAIKGSIDAVSRLKKSKLPVRFCTNETTITRKAFVEKLVRLGFDIKEEEVFPPIPALCKVLRQRDHRPHLLVHPNSLPDFQGIETDRPNCVVIGDAEDGFSYENLNKAFQTLIALEKPILYSLGKGKYYRNQDKLVLDVGSFCRALEFACDVEAEIVGKPSPIFFNTAVNDMNVPIENVVMVGDDVVSDVGGSMACGMRGVLVRTGKYRPQDEQHATVKPSAIVDNLAQAVDFILGTDEPNLMDMK